MRRNTLPIPTMIIAGCVFLALVLIWRIYVSDLLIAGSAKAVRDGQPISEVYRLAERAEKVAGSDARSYLFRGLAAYGAAADADTDTRQLWLAMASRELADAVRRNPMEGVAFRALAHTADGLLLPNEALRFAEASVNRQPASPDNLWVLARLLAPGSDARAEAYARLTALRPQLTRNVLAEIGAGGKDLSDAARYVARRGDTYVEWAHATTETVRSGRIAEMGLEYVDHTADDAQRQVGWLSYYVGLSMLDEDPATAAEWLEKATTVHPGSHAFERNYGFALLKTGEHQAAREAFLRSTRLYADLANAAHLGLAQANEELGNHTQALALYRRLSDTPRIEDWVKSRARAGIGRIESSSP